MVKEERIEGILILTLDRPEKSNALTLGMMDALLRSLNRAKEDKDVRCVLLKGQGKNFCAGRDFLETEENPTADFVILFDDAYTSIFQAMRRLSKPVIAAVHGHAVGGGFSLAMGSDFLIVHSNARFGCL